MSDYTLFGSVTYTKSICRVAIPEFRKTGVPKIPNLPE